MDNHQYVQDQINRYVYQVSRYLVGKNKEDIEKEIRSVIEDMLESKCRGREAVKEDIEAVFAELGRPAILAAKYNDSKKYLIGPALYPIYLNVLKIAIPIAVGLVLVTNLILILTGNFAWEQLGSITGTAFMVFSIVTLIFGFIEWKGVSLDELYDGKIELPPVPVKKARIHRADPIVSLVFSGIFICLFVFAPQFFGFWYGDKGFIPIFDVNVIRSLMGLFVLCFATSVVKDIFRLIEGRYTIRLMIVTIFCNAVNLVLVFYIIRNFGIWNSNFPEQLKAIADVADIRGFHANWETVLNNVILWIVAFGAAADTLSSIVKTLMYGLKADD